MSPWSLLLVFVGAASIPAHALALELGRAIPPGQEELLSRMLGRDAPLPGNCKFDGGGVEATIVVARYVCGDDAVTIELRAVDDAPASAMRTQQFAIVVRNESAPTGLPEAVAALVRIAEDDFEWKPVSTLRAQVFGQRLSPMALAGCAGGILLIGLLVQYVVATRLVPHQEPDVHLFASRGRITALRELFRRTQRRRDRHVVATLCLVVVFMFVRLIFLTRLPVYVDESVHLYWARGFLDPNFVAEFSVGRWLPIRIMAFFLLLPVDPLLAGRLGSVAMGLAVLVGCIVINRELFSWTEGLLAGVIYTILPFALLYDRLALTDVYLSAFGTWFLYCSILAARRRQPAPLMAMSVCTYAAILSKPTAAPYLVIPILVSLFVVGRGDRVAYLARVLPTVVGGAALLGFLLWLGYGTNLLTTQIAFEGREQLTRVLLPNLERLSEWLTALLTAPVALLTIVASVAALVGSIAGARREGFLALLLAMTVLPYAAVSKTWYPSYLLFAVVPISLLLARAIVASVTAVPRVAAKLGVGPALPIRRAGYVVVTLFLVGATAPLDVALLAQPQDAALPSLERDRYVRSGLSGYGLPELADFLRAQAQTQPLNVVRFDLVQPPKEGLEVYLPAIEAIRLYAFDHRDEHTAAQITSLTKTRRTLFVSNPEAEESMGALAATYIGKAVRVWSYVRPGAQTRLEVWEVKGDG